MGTLVILGVFLIAFLIFWLLKNRSQKQIENAYLLWTQDMVAHGVLYTVSVDDLDIISTTKREAKEHGYGDLGQALAMSEYLGMSEPQYETTILTRFRTYLTIDGERVEVYSQLFPKDKDNMKFSLIGKEHINIYLSPDGGAAYFDV